MKPIRQILTALCAFAIAADAYADTKIPNLPNTSSVSGADLGVVDQGGTTKNATWSAILNSGIVSSYAPASYWFNPQTGTTYTLLASDLAGGSGEIITMSNAGANTLTIPLFATVAFPTGWQITVQQTGAGTTTIAGISGVTLSNPNGVYTLAGQNAVVTLIHTATNGWLVLGQTGPAALSATSLSAMETSSAYSGAQLAADYNSSNRGRLWTDSGGMIHLDSPDAGQIEFDVAGAEMFKFTNGISRMTGLGGVTLRTSASAGNLTVARFDVSAGGNTGTGDDNDLTGNTLGLLAAAHTVATLTHSTGGTGGLFGTVATTVSDLPAASGMSGKFANVSDANSPTTGSAVTGSGSSAALVWSNGTNWIVVVH